MRHVLGWTTEPSEYDDMEGFLKAPALVFGSSWHAGMDAMWAAQGIPAREKATMAHEAFLQEWESSGFPADLTMAQRDQLGARTPGVAQEMYYSYATQREKVLEECTVLAIEQPIAMPFPNTEDTWYIGKLDKVFRWNGTHIGEHKTTSAYSIAKQFQPDWTEQWNSSPQVKGYQVVGSLYYPDLQDVWVDGALVHKKVHDAFKFIPVAHGKTLLQEWVMDTGVWIHTIQSHTEEYKRNGNLERGTFPRNEESCFGKYSKCPFLSICSTCSDPSTLEEVPAGYKVEPWEPFDELGIDKLANKE